MILWKLFYTFFEIGAFSFGGGYGMIALMRELVLAADWLTEEELLDVIAVAESTPGPIAVNLATFIGAKHGGVAGAILATAGVTLPAFLIILLIAALAKNLMKRKGVQAFLSGVRPAVVGLLFATAATLLLRVAFGVTTLSGGASPDLAAIGIFAALLLITVTAQKAFHKKIPPVAVILIAAVMGVILYGVND